MVRKVTFTVLLYDTKSDFFIKYRSVLTFRGSSKQQICSLGYGFNGLLIWHSFGNICGEIWPRWCEKCQNRSKCPKLTPSKKKTRRLWSAALDFESFWAGRDSESE